MNTRTLQEILSHCHVKATRGATDLPVAGLCYDSRQAAPGFLFIANKGLHVDGHRFIAAAISRGAHIIVHSSDLPVYTPGVTYLQVEDTRRAQAELAAAFYRFPAAEMKLIGVTGTDGKSSTVWFIQQLLQGMGKASGFISTVDYQVGQEIAPNPYRQSTPEALEIHSILKDMLANGKEYAILETTSHGLSPRTARLAGIGFDAAVFINIAHEHLEFHGTFDQYRQDKANLFRALHPVREGNSFGVVNADDNAHRYFRTAAGERPVYTYSLRNRESDLFATITGADIRGSDFRLEYNGKTHEGRLNIPGNFNVENLLAALLTTAKLLKLDVSSLLPVVPGLKAPRGRLYSLEEGQSFHVLVDYAHTPQSFTRLFSLMRPLTGGRLIAVFGSAGERDLAKRPQQGELAARYCDVVIITDEDPRGEDREKIMDEIAAGCAGKTKGKDLFLIPERTRALARAFTLASPGDTVLLLGKGHESSILYEDGPIPWNEIEVARELLKTRRQLFTQS